MRRRRHRRGRGRFETIWAQGRSLHGAWRHAKPAGVPGGFG
jgi:hypothetical protein